MVEQGNRKASSPFFSLRRFANEKSEKTAKAPEEYCDLCGEPIPSEHRHLLEVSTREIMCACRPCSILFDSEAASEGKYRLVPDRRLFRRLRDERRAVGESQDTGGHGILLLQ